MPAIVVGQMLTRTHAASVSASNDSMMARSLSIQRGSSVSTIFSSHASMFDSRFSRGRIAFEPGLLAPGERRVLAIDLIVRIIHQVSL